MKAYGFLLFTTRGLCHLYIRTQPCTYHLSADDTQFYLSFIPSNSTSSHGAIEVYYYYMSRMNVTVAILLTNTCIAINLVKLENFECM